MSRLGVPMWTERNLFSLSVACQLNIAAVIGVDLASKL